MRGKRNRRYKSPLRSCILKQRFDTRAEAEAEIARRTTFALGLKLYPYRCPVCGRFHLTKNPQKEEDVA